MMVVDTSVWIDYFKGKVSPETDLPDEQLDTGLVVIGSRKIPQVQEAGG